MMKKLIVVTIRVRIMQPNDVGSYVTLLAVKFTSSELGELHFPTELNPSNSETTGRVDFIHRESFSRRINSLSRPIPWVRRKITFTKDETMSLNRPHNDALVVTVDINDCEVARVLVDTGSTLDLIFYTLKRMEIEKIQGAPSELHGYAPRNYILNNFSGR